MGLDCRQIFYHLSHQGSPSLADMLTNSDIQGSDMVDMSVLRQRAREIPHPPPKIHGSNP